MKLVIVFGAFSFGGSERVASHLANYLVKRNQVVIITMKNRPVCYSIDPRVDIVNGLRNENKIGKIVCFRRVLIDKKPDLVLSFMTHINIAVLLATVGLGIPVIVSERNDPAQVPHQIGQRLLRTLMYTFAQGFVFQTEDAKNYFRRSIRKRSVIIPNPVRIAVTPASVLVRDKRIVMVSRLEKQKNIPLALRAYQEIREKHADFSLHIYGDGADKDDLERLIHDLHLEGRVVLEGNSSTLHEQIRNARIFVLSSNYEGMPNALMEAMALGIAPVSTDCPCGGPRSLIEDGINGYLIPVNDWEALARRIEMLIRNDSVRIKMATESLDVNKKFSFEKIMEKWEQYIYKVG